MIEAFDRNTCHAASKSARASSKDWFLSDKVELFNRSVWSGGGLQCPIKAHPVSVAKSSYAMNGMGRATAARGSWSGLRALSTARTLQRCSLGGTTPSEVPRVHFYTSAVISS